MKGFTLSQPVFLTDVAVFLPNAPVGNDEMEAYLGRIGGAASRTRRIILRNNGIKSRHYALDRETGRLTHTNAEMTAEAVRALRPYGGFAPADIELLACGTSTPDLLMPGHASMVHGELGGGPLEAVSAAGICMAGMAAMKYAFLSVASGATRNAAATGSELASSYFRSAWCAPPPLENPDALEERPVLAFEADFLRWMLSDGAGAAFLQDRPAEGRLSLRIDWIEARSFAHELETCMFAGGVKEPGGGMRGWRTFEDPAKIFAEGAHRVQQDVRLLNDEIVRAAVDRALLPLIEKRGLRAQEVDWFLPHYSSEYFRKPLSAKLTERGFPLPEECWFTNLSAKGNTGSASIYIILEELFHSGRLRRGDRLLAFIPESGRFSMCYMHLTAV